MSARASDASSTSSNGETQPLLASEARGAAEASETKEATVSVGSWIKLVVALFAIFLAHADSSLVIATYGQIASSFQASSEASWLLTSYLMGYTVSLPIYGVLGDRYGRKMPLLLAFTLFGSGTLLSGVAWSILWVIVGRVIAGLGGAGITCLIDTIATEIAPLSQVAVLRSWLNIAGVVGRGGGGPLGGLIYDLIGWRWSFLSQVPIIAICLAVAAWQKLPQASTVKEGEARQKKKFDFLGLLTFGLAMVSLLSLLDLASKDGRIQHIIFIASAASTGVFGLAFILIEAYWAENPMIPLSLIFERNRGSIIMVQGLFFCAHTDLLTNTAEYFIRTQNVSSTVAALHIAPAPFGNAIGGLIAGKVIQKTKRCRILSLSAAVAGIISYMLILLRWRGDTNIVESLYIGTAAFGVGMVSSSQFIALGAASGRQSQAMAISLFLLGQQLGALIGTGASAAILRKVFRDSLIVNLQGRKGWRELIDRVLGATRFASTLPPALRSLVLASYLEGFRATAVFTLVTAGLMLPFLALERDVPFD